MKQIKFIEFSTRKFAQRQLDNIQPVPYSKITKQLNYTVSIGYDNDFECYTTWLEDDRYSSAPMCICQHHTQDEMVRFHEDTLIEIEVNPPGEITDLITDITYQLK